MLPSSTFFIDNQAVLVDALFLAMALSTVYYFVTTTVYEVSCLVHSFNERHRKATLDNSDHGDLDAMIARNGVFLSAIIVHLVG